MRLKPQDKLTVGTLQYLHVVVNYVSSSAAYFLSGGPVERGGSEEEAGSSPGEHVKPHELLQQNMDSKARHLYADRLAVDLNQTHRQSVSK